MDGNRFDNLSRALTRGLTRRGAIKTLAGALLGGSAIAAVDEADAAACKGIGASCSASARCCQRLTCDAVGKRCLGLETARGCGSSDALCRTGFVCRANMCVIAPRTIGQTCQLRGAKNRRGADGLVCSDQTCLGLLTATGCDGDNALCDGDLVCRIDTCLPIGELDDTCDEDGDCENGLVCTSGACAPDCTPSCGDAVCGDDGCGGSCGTCDGSETCESGECRCDGVACVQGATCCTDTCKDLTSDGDNCGACGTACTDGQRCASSTCVGICYGYNSGYFTIDEVRVGTSNMSPWMYTSPNNGYGFPGAVGTDCDADDDCQTNCPASATAGGTTFTTVSCGCAKWNCNYGGNSSVQNSGYCAIYYNG